MIVKESKYKGHNLIQIFANDGDSRPIISFGLRKAKAIVACIGQIKEFIAKYSTDEES